VNVNFKSSINQSKSLRFLKSNDGKKTLMRSINLPQAPITPWSSVLNSSYGSNIVAAYDFRDGSGSVLTSKVGPTLEAAGNITFNSDGAVFTRSPNSYIFSNNTINVTYPHTLVVIGKTINNTSPERVLVSAQTTKWAQTSSTNTIIFSRSGGFLPFNGLDNQPIGYAPDGTEWYFLAISFSNSSTSRFAVRKLSGNLNGSVTTDASPNNFNGYIGFGAGFASTADYNFDGTLRLALFINQSFSTENAMNNLFNTFINGGPASDLTLQ
jgi:hypothetical protein